MKKMNRAAINSWWNSAFCTFIRRSIIAWKFMHNADATKPNGCSSIRNRMSLRFSWPSGRRSQINGIDGIRESSRASSDVQCHMRPKCSWNSTTFASSTSWRQRHPTMIVRSWIRSVGIATEPIERCADWTKWWANTRRASRRWNMTIRLPMSWVKIKSFSWWNYCFGFPHHKQYLKLFF